MKTKIIFIVSYLLVIFGWFPFIFLAAGFAKTPEIGMNLAMIGFLICLIGCVTSMVYLHGTDIFKSIDRLNEERENYHQAMLKYENASEELKRKLLNQ